MAKRLFVEGAMLLEFSTFEVDTFFKKGAIHAEKNFSKFFLELLNRSPHNHYICDAFLYIQHRGFPHRAAPEQFE